MNLYAAAGFRRDLPADLLQPLAAEGLGLLESIPLWLVSLLGSLFITVMSFILLLTVYGRFFRLYMFTALAPLPLASFIQPFYQVLPHR